MRLTLIAPILYVLICVALAGCGGGGGDSGPTVIPHDPPPASENQAPTITSLSPAGPVDIDSGRQREITVAAADPDGDPLTYVWQTTAGTVLPPTGSFRTLFTAPTTSTPVNVTVTVTVSDDHAHPTTAEVVFNVEGAAPPPVNNPPVVNSVTASPATVNVSQATVLTADATDPESDPLSYVWFADAGSLSDQSGSSITWTAPSTAGEYSVTVTVSDGVNPAVLRRIDITVGGGEGEPVTNGLTAKYIKNSGSLAHPILSDGTVVVERIDANINFDWARLSPAPELITVPATGDASDFGVRWTGHLLCDAAGLYTFKARFDDGVRVFIWNDLNQRVTVIDGWNTGPLPALQGEIQLQGNKWYPIQVDFFEDEANAYVNLSWIPPGGTEQIVPSNKLRVD